MKSKKNLVWFEEIGKNDVDVVGGKGANLGEMINAKLPVPYGFVVTAGAYFHFLKENNLSTSLRHILENINVDNAHELEEAGKKARTLLLEAEMPADLKVEIVRAYEHLLSRRDRVARKLSFASQAVSHIKNAISDPLVAVRSSATAEDLPTASFAGQQETYLNVSGSAELLMSVKKCWASLFTDRAIYYRVHQNFAHEKVGLATVVQLMVQSETSGVAFSVDPVTGDASHIMIEAIFGLGEYIVQGTVTPDHYQVDKKSLAIVKKNIKYQTVMLTKKGKTTKDVILDKTRGSKQKITDKQVIEVAELIRRIERHYFFPQDVEWAIEDGVVYAVQSRPITTIDTKKDGESLAVRDDPASAVVGPKESLIVTGDPASPGLAMGTPRVLTSPKENDKVKDGDILVAAYTSPDFVPAMKRASAIVTEVGGRTSHAAIVSRELGIPAIVGAEGASKLLEKLPTVSVNGSTGDVYKGSIFTKEQLESVKRLDNQSEGVTTVTKLYVNLAQPESAERVAKMNVDGIGLLRAEFIVAHMGVHPRALLKQGKRQEFIDSLAAKITEFVKPFAPRPVIYRATDFRTNEYRHLKGGEEFEPQEENPMIGYRGASRYLHDEEVFDMELEAIKKVRKAGFKNLHLMIPFVRIPQEIFQIREILKKRGIDKEPTFKLWMMVEVPSSAILIEDFIKAGIDGISIGTNDLTMLLLGVDRDNQEIAYLYDERNPVVLWALERVITTAKKYNITTSICGQAPSDYPEICERLVQWGVTSMSVTPDVIDRTRLLIADAEKKLWEKSKRSEPEKS